MHDQDTILTLSLAPPLPPPPIDDATLSFAHPPPQPPSPKSPLPPCTECGKQLCGHMRCHPEQFPAAEIGAGNNLALVSCDNQPSNKASKRSPSDSPAAVYRSPTPPPPETSGDALAHPCIECDRQFATRKALHGHMRTHPERPYRGMTKPDHDDAAFRDQFDANDFEVADILLVFSLRARVHSTSKAAKRSALASPAARGDDAAVHECGVCGMVFANGRALGGHKRIHREGAAAAAASLELSLAPPGQ